MIQDPVEQARLRALFPFLQTDLPDLQAEFFSRASLVHLPAEHIICHDGGRCSHLPLLLSGTARIYKLGENGREVTLYRIGAGESCVVTASCILSERPFPAFAVCESDVTAAVVSLTEVQAWMTQSSAWRNFIFTLVADRLSEVFAVLDAVLFQPLDQRLAGLLLHRWRNQPKGTAILRTTHQALAADLGSSREVITRILREFEQSGLLHTGRGQIEILDPGLLEDRVNPGLEDS